MNKILPIIVIYNIELKDAIAYQTLIEVNDIRQFVVYDNSPISDNRWKAYAPEAIYLSDTYNSGLSKAYNKGAEIARQKGFSHVLLLDQDTRFDANAWQTYLHNLDYPGMLVPLMKTTTGTDFSPVSVNGLFSRAAHGLAPAEYSLTSYAAVNSGCCIPVDLFFKAGGYVENVKLDFADFQFQLRLRCVQPYFRIIDTTAIQDFSNDCRESSKVKIRYKLYVESARYYEADGFTTKVRHLCDVLKHTLSLTARMRSFYFIGTFITHYLMKFQS